jgi:Zn-dependent M28 family amino/carboxypeptidase
MFLPEDQKRIPWDRLKGYFGQPTVTTLLSDGTPVMIEPRITLVGYVSDAGARKLFAGAPLTIEAASEATATGQAKAVALASTASLSVTSQYEETSSENVVARLEGTDPALKSTSVVLTAHLDHIGIKPQGDGDRINNGAYDNAAGSAVLLEVARSFAAAGAHPRRSIVIVFVTGEEKGLQGSNFFAHYPVKAAGKIVANVNLDMPLFLTASSDIIAWGSENSSLDDTVKRAIKGEGYALSPDPIPEENIFVRSDQYSFVKQGIPSVYLEPGFTAADPKVNGRELLEKFRTGNYHQPSDDLSLPMDQAAAARFAEANYLVARAIADDPVAPTWKPGNFFGRVFGRK